MAGKMTPLPSVSVEKKQEAATACPFPAVRVVSIWALLTAIAWVVFVSLAIGYALAYALNQFHVPCDPNSVVLRCAAAMTDAEATRETALGNGMLCCSAAQVAAAALALLLPNRRCRTRRALAYAALAAAVASHCLYVSAVGLVLTADPGYLLFRISCSTSAFILAAGDLLCFLALLLGEE